MRTQWSSRFGYIMATTGAAVGLGNIWKFPYMAGSHGGGAFVLVYLLCVALLAIPALLAEILLGKLGHRNAVDSLRIISRRYHASPLWAGLGYLGAVTLLLVLSFYSVVAGWALAYLKLSLTQELAGSAVQLNQQWQGLLSSVPQLLLWHTVFMTLTVVVVARGARGIERISQVLMPGLFILLITLSFFSLRQGDAARTYQFLFAFHLQDFNRELVLSALGHAFFSLATGAGCMLTYGSYLPPKVPFIASTLVAAALDISVALISGLAIFPLVFAHHLIPSAGPGLMFNTLPLTFSSLALGPLVGVAFFTLLWFAAWGATLSMAEPVVAILTEEFSCSRTKAALISGVTAWALGLLSLLSFNHWSEMTVCGRTIFELITELATDWLLPLGSLGFILFVAWIVPRRTLEQAWGGPRLGFTLWYGLLRYAAPLGIGVIFAVHCF